MTVTHYMGLCAIERAEYLAIATHAERIEFARGFYAGVPVGQEKRSALHMATIIEALCDELEASLKKIERLEECQSCEASLEGATTEDLVAAQNRLKAEAVMS